MTVRKKILTAMFMVLAGLIGIILLISSVVLLREAGKQDEQKTRDMVLRGSGVLSRTILEIQRVNKDWSGWDDTCAFVRDHNQAYIDSNLVDAMFISNQITDLVIVNLSGDIIFAKQVDLKRKQAEPFSPGLLRLLSAEKNLLYHHSTKSCTAGIWFFDGNPVILVSSPILTSLLSGPVRGAVIFGKKLDESVVNDLSNLAQIKMKIFSVGSSDIPQRARKTLLNASENQPVTTGILDNNIIEGFSLIKDGSGKPSAIIRVVNERTHYQTARSNCVFLIAFLILIGGAAGGMTLVLLDRVVLKRLASLHGFIQKIESENELSDRHADKGNDELSHFSEAVNNLLERLRNQFVECRRVEDALRKSEGKYQVVSENIPVAVYSALPDNRASIIFISGKVRDLTGYSVEDFSREPDLWLKIICPDDKASVVQALHEQVGKKQSTGEMCYRIFTKARQIKWIRNKATLVHDLQGALIRIDGFMEDVTEQREAVNSLRESEERYRSVITQSADGIFMADSETRLLIEANPVLCAMLEYSSGEIRNLRIEDFLPSESKGIENIFKEIIEKGSVRSEGLCRKKDGTGFAVEVSLDLIGLRGKKVFSGVVRDIGERKRLETQLFQSQKMEAIGTLAGGIAHDFNNLLMGVLGRVSLMHMEIDRNHPFFEYLGEIEFIVRRAADLTGQLLGFARGGKYEVSPTDLNELLKNSVDMFGRTKKEITIHKSFEPDLFAVEVDRAQIEQVLLNLFVDAWQAMPGGGALYVSTNNVVIDKGREKSANLVPGNYVKMSVTDTGIGMDEETQKRVFEPFFTTKESGKGTGLGLASSYGIIRNHGGLILVDSEKGKGTTFTIYLPVTEKVIEKEKESAAEFVKGKGKVLLIDDEKMVLGIGQKILRLLGYTVISAQGGQEAITLYQQQGETIDLVILDIVMPEVSGEDVFDAITTINPGVKILLASGYSIDGQASKLLVRGCAGFIQKPFGAQELSRKLMEFF